MATFTWATPVAIATSLSTGLDSLANAAYSAVSAAYDNETSLYYYLDVELVLASLTPTAGGYCALYLIESLDSGSTFEDGGGAVAPYATSLVCAFPLSTSAGAKRQVITNLIAPPYQFKLVLGNFSGVTLASSANTVRYRLHNETSV